MKIMWHGVAPWAPTGYGSQSAVWLRRFAQAGHDMICSAQSGAMYGQVTNWENIPILPSVYEHEGTPLVVKQRLETLKPDLCIVFFDCHMINPPQIFADWNTAAWIPIDSGPLPWSGLSGLSFGDRQFLEGSGAKPIAMSLHGQRVLAAEGYPAPYVPHGIDCYGTWRPLEPAEREHKRRTEMGLEPGQFAVGINGTNIDPWRKALPEQLAAFAKFHVKHPEAVLFLHTQMRVKGSLDLAAVAHACGLDYPAVRMTSQAAMYEGSVTQDTMRDWYGSLDVLMGASYGEGFGLPALEAQACGTPVILTKAHTGPELVGPGWIVGGQPWWNGMRMAWWTVPSVPGLVRALDEAFTDARNRREAAREFAMGYDTEAVWPLWEKTLGELNA